MSRYRKRNQEAAWHVRIATLITTLILAACGTGLIFLAANLWHMGVLAGRLPGASSELQTITQKLEQPGARGPIYWLSWSSRDIHEPGYHKIRVPKEVWESKAIGESIHIVHTSSHPRGHLQGSGEEFNRALILRLIFVTIILIILFCVLYIGFVFAESWFRTALYLALLLTIAAAATGSWWTSDTPFTESPDMQPAPISPTTASDAFPLLMEASEILATPSTPAEEPTQQLRALELLKLAANSDTMRTPPDSAHSTSPPHYLSTWSDLLAIQQQQTATLLDSGNATAALENIEIQLKLSSLIQSSGGNLHVYDFASRLKLDTLETLRNALPQLTQPSEELLDFALKLEPFRPDSQALAQSMRTDYTSVIEIIDLLDEGRLLLQDLTHPNHTIPTTWLDEWFTSPLFFKPNRTRTSIRNAYINAISNIPQPFHQMEWPPDSLSHSSHLPLVIPGGNPSGQIVQAILLKDLRHFLHTKCLENSSLSATQLAIALLAYKRQNQILPTNLEPITPSFLERIPVDDFTASPLRLDTKQHRILAGDSNPISFSIQPIADYTPQTEPTP